MAQAELSEAQAVTLSKLDDVRWATIGTAEFPRPTITALARAGFVELADKLKRAVDPRTAAWAAQFARLSREGVRAKSSRAVRRRR